eukprot:scaffold55_cov225-Ochromonas_danica.AAC.7
MAEVKRIPDVLMLSKREVSIANPVMEHFKSFIEDYNTATMPHEKFYNYEKWEMANYRNQQVEALRRNESEDFIFNDEASKRIEKQREKQLEEQRAFAALRAQMTQDKDKVESMKRQAGLQTELQLAYKRGDMVTVRRLERLLAPEENGQPPAKRPRP